MQLGSMELFLPFVTASASSLSSSGVQTCRGLDSVCGNGEVLREEYMKNWDILDMEIVCLCVFIVLVALMWYLELSVMMVSKQ